MLKIKEARIASCSKVTNENVIEMQKVLEEAKHRVKQSNPKQVSLPISITKASNFGNSSTSDTATGVRYHGLPTPSIDLKRRKRAIGSIKKAFNMGAREIVDSEIGMMFYIGGLSFHFDILIIFMRLKAQVNFQVMSHQTIMH